MRIRSATRADMGVIESLMAPEIAAGRLLTPSRAPDAQFVAEIDGDVVGAVALTPWSAEVVELGSLVSGRRGYGIGSALVGRAVEEAAHRYGWMVALTSIPGFFTRAGFQPHHETPWRWARGDFLRVPDGNLGKGMLYKSSGCAGCPRLRYCAQTLMVRPLLETLR
ncbi:MAG: GNAT family N-acetyltransferase [Myxococcota bacterium]